MSIDLLMNQSVTLRVPSGGTRDDIGNLVPTYSTLSTTMYIEPKSGKEDMANRNTPIGDWLGIGRIDINFENWDQIVYGPHTFDIVSPVRPFYNPRNHADDHWEMDLQEVDD